jgi:hypothetical protein
LPHLSFPYDTDNVPSLDLRLQVQGGPAVDFAGTVDSGATSTVLSIRNAEALGLGDLRHAGPVTVADRKQVPSYTAKAPIAAQVLLVAEGIVLDVWGPSFYIDAIFLEDADPLWGQSDFFATYEVTFQRNITPATFGLSYKSH